MIQYLISLLWAIDYLPFFATVYHVNPIVVGSFIQSRNFTCANGTTIGVFSTEIREFLENGQTTTFFAPGYLHEFKAREDFSYLGDKIQLYAPMQEQCDHKPTLTLSQCFPNTSHLEFSKFGQSHGPMRHFDDMQLMYSVVCLRNNNAKEILDELVKFFQ
jgi:hypothetical protein